jgi:hypothetical protein
MEAIAESAETVAAGQRTDEFEGCVVTAFIRCCVATCRPPDYEVCGRCLAGVGIPIKHRSSHGSLVVVDNRMPGIAEHFSWSAEGTDSGSRRKVAGTVSHLIAKNDDVTPIDLLYHRNHEPVPKDAKAAFEQGTKGMDAWEFEFEIEDGLLDGASEKKQVTLAKLKEMYQTVDQDIALQVRAPLPTP